MLTITGPGWITEHAVRDVFGVSRYEMYSRPDVMRIRRFQARYGVHLWHRGDVERLANRPGDLADRARYRLHKERHAARIPTGCTV